jgi:hypothetical protein
VVSDGVSRLQRYTCRSDGQCWKEPKQGRHEASEGFGIRSRLAGAFVRDLSWRNRVEQHGRSSLRVLEVLRKERWRSVWFIRWAQAVGATLFALISILTAFCSKSVAFHLSTRLEWFPSDSSSIETLNNALLVLRHLLI